MNIKSNIARFEGELVKVQRPGVDKLLAYIRKSDFYKAPASTKYHLSCEGGLLQHSLNVLDAMREIMPLTGYDANREYKVAGRAVAKIPDESVIIIALLHDICKTHFYTTSWRNAKNEETGKWEKVPFFMVDDKMPLGHGAKSAMIVKQFMELTTTEMYAIWWHMGFTDTQDAQTLSQAIDLYPVILATHTADMMASHFMEDTADNKQGFTSETVYAEPPMPEPESAAEYADNPTTGEMDFEEAPPLQEA